MRVLITGGAGFLGQHTMRELRDQAAAHQVAVHIRVLDLVDAPDADECVIGSVTDPEAVRVACESMDVVLHMASMIDWGARPRAELLDVNLGGTEQVISACHQMGVAALLYTSSIDSILDGSELVDVDESHPYPSTYPDAYCESKGLAEQAVLAANGPVLRTAAIRPCGIYGEADGYHVERVLEEARGGRLTFRVGGPDVVFPHVYVGNVAHAHALAAFALLDPSPAIAGNAYFCTDGQASNFFDFMQVFVEGVGYTMPSRRLPDGLVVAVGTVMGWLSRTLAPVWQMQPSLTRSSALTLTRSLSVRGERLERDLGYAPRYSEQEATERVLAHYLPLHQS